MRNTPCPECLLYRSCVFPYLFETPPPRDSRKMRKYPAAPHPFVLRIEPGQESTHYQLGLALIGQAGRQLPYFIHALTEAGRQGIGSRRQPFELLEVRQAHGPDLTDWTPIHTPDTPLNPLPPEPLTLPILPERLTVHILSPLRLKQDNHLVTPASFRFSHFFSALLRRRSLLSYFHTDQPWEADFAGLVQRASTVQHQTPRLQWYDWTRFSSRQDTSLEMGGLLGHFELSGDDVAEFWPLLWQGQWTHVGKGATLGLGRYRIEPASLPTRTATPERPIMSS